MNAGLESHAAVTLTTAKTLVSVVIPVYHNATRALSLADALTRQRLPDGHLLEIIVVDDGSGKESVHVLKGHQNEALRVIALEKNSGRSNACHSGAIHARGEYLAFIDSDCEPADTTTLDAHLQGLRAGAIGSCGPIATVGDRFWARYQRAATERRQKKHAAAGAFHATTANFVVRKDVYLQAGGFDSRYREYGFEDRDLLVRLAQLGSIVWCPDAKVVHLDEPSLPGVLDKMRRAGGSSAELFSRDHPDAYRALGYAAIDARLHPWVRVPCALLKPLLGFASAIDAQLDKAWLPYPVAKAVVKLLTALAFACGTTVSR